MLRAMRRAARTTARRANAEALTTRAMAIARGEDATRTTTTTTTTTTDDDARDGDDGADDSVETEPAGADETAGETAERHGAHGEVAGFEREAEPDGVQRERGTGGGAGG